MTTRRNRTTASLNGRLLVRKPAKALLRPGDIEGAGDMADAEIDSLTDTAEPVAHSATLIALPVPPRAGPIDRTGRTLSLRLDGERHHALQMASRASGLSQQQLVITAIDHWLSARHGTASGARKGD
jgi:hypothetical protein